MVNVSVNGRAGRFRYQYATIYVGSGAVVATVKGELDFEPCLCISHKTAGGYQRSSPTDKRLFLDASPSVDQNSPGASGLAYAWTCTIGTLSAEFGRQCGLFGENIQLTPLNGIATIPPNTMNANETYVFVVVVSTQDGRSDSKSVQVLATLAGSVYVSITSGKRVVNFDQKLQLQGFVASNTSVDGVWRTYLGTTPAAAFEIRPTALTQVTQSFTPQQARTNIFFPLAYEANTFEPGVSYTFKLQGCPPGRPELCSFGSVVIYVNAPPYGGVTQVNPNSGSALSTIFNAFAIGWITLPISYPLSYSFSYNTDPSLPDLFIQQKSAISYVQQTLPAGLSAQEFFVKMTGIVIDTYDCSANASALVKVTIDESVNLGGLVTNVLGDSVATFGSNGNVNNLLSAVNAGSSTLNVNNCTATPNSFCSSLNRGSCVSVANTCESCLPGFAGISGPANKKCFNISSGQGSVGYPCQTGDDCVFGHCSPENTCEAPMKECPSNDVSTVCSGNGVCLYYDGSGSEIEPCTIFSVFCTPKCSCDVGYGASDCSMTTQDLETYDQSRTTMCKSLLVAASNQDLSAKLLDTIVGSLLSSFIPDQVTSPEGKAACTAVLNFLSQAASEGYLVGTLPSTSAFLARTASSFVSPPSASGNSSDSSAADAAVSGLSSGVGGGMVGGEPPKALLSANIRMEIQNPLASSLVNASLGPPSTAAEAQYGTIQPKVGLPGAGLSACGIPGGYAALSVMQWGSNPYAGSDEVKSPVLRFGSGSSGGARRRLMADEYEAEDIWDEEPPRELLETIYVPHNFTPVYYISMQFAAKRNFNFSALEGRTLLKPNLTLPDCTFHDGTKYVPCHKCNVTSYTDYNVTFGCYDLSTLCPPNSQLGARRRLREGSLKAERDFFEGISTGRILAGDDDFSKSNSGGGANVASYGALLAALLAEIAKTLSANPFAINWAEHIPLIVFVGCLTLALSAGSYYMLKWDYWERNFALYRQKEQREYIHKLVTDDLEKGGDGYTFLVQQKQAERLEAISKVFSARNWVRAYKDMMNPKRELGLDQQTPGAVLLNDYHNPVLEDANDDQIKLNPVVDNSPTLARNIAVSVFFDKVLPSRVVRGGGNILTTFLDCLCDEHSYLSMLSGPSFVNTRTCRYLTMARGILINFFVDTLFFKLMYPPDTACTGFTIKQLCLTPKSSMPPQPPLCMWNKVTKHCTLRPPPKDPLTPIVLSVLCILFSVPVDILVGLVQDLIASKRPRLEQIGLNTDAWVGSASAYPKSEGDASREYSEIENRQTEELVRHSELGKVFTEMGLNSGMTRAEMDAMAKAQYEDMRSPQEEVVGILRQVKEFFVDDIEAPKFSLREMVAAGKKDERRDAKITAIVNQLGVYPNGDAVPLTLRQRFLYSSPHQRLVEKIIRVRKRAADVEEGMTRFLPEEFDFKDAYLMQKFVLEQLHVSLRFGVSKQLFRFEGFQPEEVGGLIWIVAWAFIIGVLMFFVYWIFAWGAAASVVTFEAWGINFALSFIQDALVLQPIRVLMISVLSIEMARPQLRAIYRTLNAVATAYIQDGVDRNSDFRVCQRLSASCRAARLHKCKILPSAYILRQIDDIDVHNCKSGSNFTLGILIFAAVAIPGYMVAVNESAGSTLVDYMLTVFVGALTLGFSLLLSKGVELFIIPFVVVAAYYAYKIFILHPAIRRVKTLTQIDLEKNRLWKSSKRSKAKTSTLSWLQRLFQRLLDKFLLWYIYFILEWLKDGYGKYVVPPRSNSSPRDRWRLMNMPTVFQGHAESLEDDMAVMDEVMDGMDTGEGNKDAENGIVDDDGNKLFIPESILAMRASVFAADFAAVGSAIVSFIETRYFKKAGVSQTMEQSESGLRVSQNLRNGRASAGIRDNSVTFDVNKALQRMFSDRFKGESMDVVQTDELYFLRFLEKDSDENIIDTELLKNLLNGVWDYFYPGGTRLSDSERREVEDAFSAWASAKAVKKEKKKKGKKGGRSAPSTVLVTEFSVWFVKMFHLIISTRQALGEAPVLEGEEETISSLDTSGEEIKMPTFSGMLPGVMATSNDTYTKWIGIETRWFDFLTSGSDSKSDSSRSNWIDHLSASGDSVGTKNNWMDLSSMNSGDDRSDKSVHK